MVTKLYSLAFVFFATFAQSENEVQKFIENKQDLSTEGINSRSLQQIVSYKCKDIDLDYLAAVSLTINFKNDVLYSISGSLLKDYHVHTAAYLITPKETKILLTSQNRPSYSSPCQQIEFLEEKTHLETIVHSGDLEGKLVRVELDGMYFIEKLSCVVEKAQVSSSDLCSSEEEPAVRSLLALINSTKKQDQMLFTKYEKEVKELKKVEVILIVCSIILFFMIVAVVLFFKYKQSLYKNTKLVEEHSKQVPDTSRGAVNARRNEEVAHQATECEVSEIGTTMMALPAYQEQQIIADDSAKPKYKENNAQVNYA